MLISIPILSRRHLAFRLWIAMAAPSLPFATPMRGQCGDCLGPAMALTGGGVLGIGPILLKEAAVFAQLGHGAALASGAV